MWKRTSAFLSLFTSLSTLVCCALPALFVSLGLGAAFAGLIAQAPGLIWMSENKPWFFGAGALMLTLGGWAQYQARNLPCPIDREHAQACTQARRWSKGLYFVSVAIYLIGALFAFGSSLLV